MRGLRQHGEAGKPSPASAGAMEPPPPAKRRAGSRAGSSGSGSCGQQGSCGQHVLPIDAASAAASTAALKKLQKKLREAERLVVMRDVDGKALSADEHAKAESIAGLQAQIELLKVSASAAGSSAAHSQAHSSGGAAVFSRPAAACLASNFNAAAESLQSLPSEPEPRTSTRASHIKISQELAAQRKQLDAERLVRAEQAAAAELELWQVLRAPLDSWDSTVMWQLAMCEYALRNMDDSSSNKQLQLEFRALCEEARHPGEVPRLHGSLQIGALRTALLNSQLLQCELRAQLERYKRLYVSLMSGFGRFRQVWVLQGETVLALMTRTHVEALQWRPPGRDPAEKLALVSKAKGRYTLEWREGTYDLRHFDMGRTVSLRGTVGGTRGFLRSRLKQLPEGERPSVEDFTTVRLHDLHAHIAYLNKALVNSFQKNRCTLQSDEVTLNKISWTVVVINSPRGDELDLREREVLACHKLQPDAKGKSKTGANVGGANALAVAEAGVPVANIDYYCTDTTPYASGLNLPRSMGGEGGEGGAYAHLWSSFRAQNHVLFFMIWCLSHITSNEVGAVMKLAGPPVRTRLLRKKSKKHDRQMSAAGQRESEGAKPERWKLVEHLNDVVYAIQSTAGCHAYVRDAEGLTSLRQFAYGSNTRWNYWIDVAERLQPATRRYDLVLAFLLHTWLLAEGKDGLSVPPSPAGAEAADADAPGSGLSGAALGEKIELLQNEARCTLHFRGRGAHVRA
jgi:hypothetical protein